MVYCFTMIDANTVYIVNLIMENSRCVHTFIDQFIRYCVEYMDKRRKFFHNIVNGVQTK